MRGGETGKERVEVFLSNIHPPYSDCSEACATANVAAHEIGHALGLEGRGHFFGFSVAEAGQKWIMGRPRDVYVLRQSRIGPQNYNTDVDKNRRILEQVNRVRPIYPD